jgi:transposase
MGKLVIMSHKEIHRLEIIQRVVEGRLYQSEAAEQLGISERQVRRLQRSYEGSGALGLVHKRRACPSNRRLPKEQLDVIMAIVRDKYYDFGPTLAAEKLAEIDGIQISKETLRKLMVEAGLWKTRTQRLKRAYQPRYRRECYGELIQIDGSEHAWFEKRGPKCSLLVFIDDATSRLMELQFVPEESTFAYFESAKRYLERHGKPVAFYSDKLSVFRVNAKNAVGGDQITQFGRALKDLNIDIICAHTPQAKGRVERANKTLQDRLIKEMRLMNISSAEEANRFMPKFIEIYNNKFGKLPVNPRNAHRDLLPHEKLEETFCWQEDRTLSNNLTFQYNKILYLVEDTPAHRKIARKRVTVCDYADGSIEVRYEGKPLPYSVLHDRLQRFDQGEVVDNKRLGNVMAFIIEKQAELNCERSKSVPKRKSLTKVAQIN